jgi:hypothetical protein
MQKILALMSMVALTSVPVAVAAQGFVPGPDVARSGLDFSLRPIRSVAGGCALAVLSSGAYAEWDSDTLVKYCVDVAKGLTYSDYRRDAE